jgi:plasmid stabilization system protein ParE
MDSFYKVIWNDEALQNVTEIMAYLIENWSQKEVDHFIDKLQQREILLSHQPKAFPLSQKGGNYRRSVLTSQISIYYKFEDETIKIQSVFDTRQDPDKLNSIT